MTDMTPSWNALFSPSRDGNTAYDFTSSHTATSTCTGPPSNANSQNLRFTSPPRVRVVSADFSQWLYTTRRFFSDPCQTRTTYA